MEAHIFPGQGSQFVGMGKDIYDKSDSAREMFEKANKIFGSKITDIMFAGSEVELRQTCIAQPAIFLHSVILATVMRDNPVPDMVAGHSLGEFSALVAVKSLSFEDGLRIVIARAEAMQKACKATPGAMAAVLGLEDTVVEEILRTIEDVVVPANYNGPEQLVISGSVRGVETACKKLKTAGAKRIVLLNVIGAFHSPLMETARVELETAIKDVVFSQPLCPIYQNASAEPVIDPCIIRRNLIDQLTFPVRWHKTILNMKVVGATKFIEIGPGNVLQNLIKRIIPGVDVSGTSYDWTINP